MKNLFKKGVNASIKTYHKNTPLHVAAMEGKKNAVKLLMDKGVDVTTRNSGGLTPLHLATIPTLIGSSVSDGQILHPKAFVLSLFKNTTHHAEKLIIVELLINKYAYLIEYKDINGLNSFHYAVMYGYPKILELLINKGLHKHPVNSYRLTPWQLAEMYGRPRILELLKNIRTYVG